MRILITNDDGIDSTGIKELARAAAEEHDIVVAAPAWNSSGASASITGVSAEGRLLTRDCQEAFPFVRAAYAVESSPAMIVRAGIQGAFGPAPDLVLSGINDGPNCGHAVLHSGTVGAALTAATHGCRSIAFSIGISDVPTFDAAAQLVPAILQWVAGLAGPLTINVNVPSVPPAERHSLPSAPFRRTSPSSARATSVCGSTRGTSQPIPRAMPRCSLPAMRL
jgi:5'-nucleotidase